MAISRCSIVLLGFLSWWLTSELVAQDEGAFVPAIVRLDTGEQLTPADLAAKVMESDVVLLGEEHNNDAVHWLQTQLIREMIEQGANVAISLEMFERDVQGIVNEYLARRISEEEFLSGSRPWKNYAQHYREIVELAKQQRIPILAANVPREIASAVAKGETTIHAVAPFRARQVSTPEDLYWEKFAKAMEGHSGSENEESARRMYHAQCLKDDTMAESIVDFLAAHQHRHVTVVHLCGKFHSDFGLGTAARISARNSLIRMAVVSTERVDRLDDFGFRQYRDRAHYMFVVPSNSQRDTH